MRTPPSPSSRPAGAILCLLALLAATLLPALHSLHPHTHAHGTPADTARHTCCHAHHHGPANVPADERPTPQDQDDDSSDHDCPICEVMRTVASGAVPPPLAAPSALALEPGLLPIRQAAAPARLILPPQRTLRGPPHC